MRLHQIVLEANIGDKIEKDSRSKKMIAIAWRHDVSIPRGVKAQLGPKPSDEDIAKKFGEMVDEKLRQTNFGDLSADNKFDNYIIRLYGQGVFDWEEISGEVVDALANWSILSRHNLLTPNDQDFNRFNSLERLTKITNDYSDQLRRLADQEKIEKHKRERKEVVLINDDRFFVAIPFNYGSCYTFNNSEGIQANFCTGGSAGLDWFNMYAPRGPIVMIFDKDNLNNVDGKWQMHAQTNQLVNAHQENRYNTPANDKKFAELFPGLMKRIVASIKNKRNEIVDASKNLTHSGYDIDDCIRDICEKFPKSCDL